MLADFAAAVVLEFVRPRQLGFVRLFDASRTIKRSAQVTFARANRSLFPIRFCSALTDRIDPIYSVVPLCLHYLLLCSLERIASLVVDL